MPDISLFEPLCEELNISINELFKAQRLNNKRPNNHIFTEVLLDYSKYIKNQNKRIILTLLFITSLLPMLMNQYGGLKGVQEISGLINLINPIGIVSLIFFIMGVWLPLRNDKMSKLIGGIGVIGMVISEIYKFFTWHVMTITGGISIQNSIQLVFPEFYIGLAVSFTMVVAYFVIDKTV